MSAKQKLLQTGFVAAVLVLVPVVAAAGTTRVWVSVTFHDFYLRAEPKGVMITSAGKLVRGEPTEREQLSGVTMVFSALHADGGLYLGTGDRGELWIRRGAKAKKLAALKGAVIVTSLVKGPPGTLYAGTLPEGRIFSVDTKTGQVKAFARVKAKHIWALHYQPKTRQLLVATGPEGTLFAVDAAGRSRVYWKSTEKHLLSMAQGPRGALFVGTAPKAIVYRIDGPNRAMAIHDFAGNEIRALVGNERYLYVAVNDITPDRRGYPKYPRHHERAGTPIRAARSKIKKLALPRLGAKQGKGGLFRVSYYGEARQLFGTSRSYFTALALDARGTLYAGDGTKGRIYVAFPDTSLAIYADVKERQILALAWGPKERFFGTGDGAAVYKMGKRGKQPEYLSPPYDTGSVARFGMIAWRVSGNVQLYTRSGNTAKPDKAWSPWRRVAGRLGGSGAYRGLVGSPPARFLQYRFVWPGASKAQVTSVRVHFTPFNRRPRITSFEPGPPVKGVTPVEKASWVAKETSVAPDKIKLSWKVVDPDGDPLAYRVYFRAIGDAVWRKVGKDDFETKTTIDWSTDGLPDGWYRLKLVASDDRTNSRARALSHTRLSPPILIDHTKPSVVGLRVGYPAVAGTARDSFSRITGISYSIDGGKRWVQVDARDGNFDQEVEAFGFNIERGLKRGVYTLLLRIYDAAGNAAVIKRRFQVR